MSENEEGQAVKSNYLNTKKWDYPIFRFLYYYYNSENNVLLDKFFEFTLSTSIPEVIFEEGFVPLDEGMLNEVLDINFEILFNY